MIFLKGISIISVYLMCYISGNCNGNFVNDYSWRDYYGVTPTDALKSGQDRNGKPIYVGQGLYSNKLIPGKIYENVSEIHIEFSTVHILKNAIKILCTPHPEIFEWVKTRFENVLDIKNKHMIFEGGYEEGFTTYVGRAVSHGELTVGKVICHGTACYKLTTIENGKWYEHDVYEILTYNENAKIKSTTSISSSTAATFYTEVYSRQPPSTVGSSSEADVEQTSAIFANTTNYVSTVLHQQPFNPTPVGSYNFGVCGNISVALYFLLVIINSYQIF